MSTNLKIKKDLPVPRFSEKNLFSNQKPLSINRPKSPALVSNDPTISEDEPKVSVPKFYNRKKVLYFKESQDWHASKCLKRLLKHLCTKINAAQTLVITKNNIQKRQSWLQLNLLLFVLMFACFIYKSFQY